MQQFLTQAAAYINSFRPALVLFAIPIFLWTWMKGYHFSAMMEGVFCLVLLGSAATIAGWIP